MWTPERTALAGAGLALMVTVLLSLLALPNPGTLLLLLPAAAGGILALTRPRSSPLLVLAGVLMAVTASTFLIAGAGLLYLPSIVLVVAAAWLAGRAGHRRVR